MKDTIGRFCPGTDATSGPGRLTVPWRSFLGREPAVPTELVVVVAGAFHAAKTRHPGGGPPHGPKRRRGPRKSLFL